MTGISHVRSDPVPETESAFLGVRESLTGRFWRARLADDRLALAMSQRLGLPDVIGEKAVHGGLL